MRTQFLIPLAAVEKLKQKARRLKKESGIAHHEALDQVAKEAGFDHWHHVAESSKAFAPTEHAYHFNVIIALDVKNAEDFHDPSGNFVEDDLAFALCGDDIYEFVRQAEEEDEESDTSDPTYQEDLHEWRMDMMANYTFFRFTPPDLPASVAEVVKRASEHCFWTPEFIWYNGVMHECPSDIELADGRAIVRFG